MPYVPVPKDLTNVKTKLVFNLTKRQLICFSLGGLVGVPAYFLTRDAIGNSPAVLVMIGLMMPFFFFAMYERDGQTAEMILRNRIRFWCSPRTRPYRTDNLYKILSQKEATAIAKNKAAGDAGKHTTRKQNQGTQIRHRR